MKRQIGVERGKMENILGQKDVMAGKMENRRWKFQSRSGKLQSSKGTGY